MNKQAKKLLKEGLEDDGKSATKDAASGYSSGVLEWIKNNPGLVGGGVVGSGLGATLSYLLGADSWPGMIGSGIAGGIVGGGAGYYGRKLYRNLENLREAKRRLQNEKVDFGSKKEVVQYLKDYNPEILDENGKLPKEHPANTLINLVKEHRNDPDVEGASLPRSWVDKLSEDKLEELGFEPSYVAVPEAGQTSVRTFRHPFNNLHFHEHENDSFIMHEDTWPSLSMLQRRRDIVGLNSGARKGLTGFVPTAVQGLKHGIVEGVPGYLTYTRNRMLGGPTYYDRTQSHKAVNAVDEGIRYLMNTTDLITPDKGYGNSVLERAKEFTRKQTKPEEWSPARAAITAGAVTGIPGLIAYNSSRNRKLNDKDVLPKPYRETARASLSTAGLIGGLMMGNKAREAISGSFNGGSPWPRFIGEVGSPVMGGLGGYMLGRHLFPSST